MINRRICILTCLTVTALAAAGCSSGSQSASDTSSGGGQGGTGAGTSASAPLAHLLPDDIKNSGTIVAGSELTVPPMTFYEADGTTIKGINYDLANAMGKKLGVKFTFQQFAFAGLQPALKSGKINIIFDVINDTKQREQVLDFIDYVKAGNTLLLQDGNPDGIHSLADLCGHSVATPRGAYQAEIIKQQSTKCTDSGKKPVTLKLYPSAPEARLQVQNGKMSAFIGNTPVLVYLAKTAGDGKTFDAVPVGGDDLYFGIAFEKSNTQLRTAVDKALRAVMEDGTYDKILKKYGVGVIAMKAPKINGAHA